MKKRSLIALLACMTLSAGAGVATIAVENAPFTAITADAATTGVATVDGTSYDSIASAISAAKASASKTLTLTSDVTSALGTLDISGLTFDLGGKTVALSNAYETEFIGNNFTITNGTFNRTNSGCSLFIGSTAGTASSVTVVGVSVNGGIYMIGANGVTYKNVTAVGNNGAGATIVCDPGVSNVTIESGEYKKGTTSLTINSGLESIITVTGGTFDTNISSFLATGYIQEASGRVVAVKPAEVNGVAYASLAEAIAVANAGDTVKLVGSTTLSERVTISQNITLDLNGKEILGAVDDTYGMIYVKTTGDLTITGNGLITNTAGYAIGNYGKVTVESGKITGEYALYNFNYNGTLYGTAVINGGTFDTNATEEGLAIANSGVLEINDGTFNATVDSTAKMTVNGGAFEEVLVKDPDYVTGVGSATEINGGTIASLQVITDAEKTIKANNSLTLDETNVTVTNMQAVASVNGVYYGTFEAAYKAANAGDTVALTDNLTLTERLEIDKEITLDLGNYAISGAVEDVFGMIYVKKTGNLTVKGNGSITNTAGYAIGNYGKVTVESGTITGTYALYNFNYNGTLYGTATINGGTFDTNATEEGLAIANSGVLEINDGTFNATVDSTAKMTVNGGAFEEVLVKDPDYVTGVGSATEINGGTIASLKVITDTNKEASNSLTLDETNTTVTNMNAAAKVDGVYYGTLQAAIDAANENDTIELLSDITVDETIVINKNLTIEGNGKTITSTMTATDNRIIDIPKTVANANVTLKNLNIVGSGDGNYSRGVNYNSNGTLTLDKVSISNVKYYAVNLPMSASSGATINVVDSEISGWAAINVWGVGVTVNVTDSTLESVWFDKNWNFGAIVLNNKNCKVNLTKTSFNKTGDVGAYSDIVLEEKTTEGTSASNTSITLSDTDATIDAVATVNGVYYGSFEEAYTAALTGSDKTIVLQKDYTVTYPADTYVDFSGLTLDLNGKTITVPFKSMRLAGDNFTITNGTVDSNGADYGLWIGANSKAATNVTIEDVKVNGGINIHNADGVTLKNVTADASAQDYYAVWVEYDAKNVVIESGSYKAGTADKAVNAATAGSVEITGGTFDTDITEYCAEGFAPVYDATAGTYTVYTEDQAGIIELEKKVAELTESLEAKAEEIKDLQTALTALETTAGNNSTTIANLQADLAAKATELANLQTALNNLDGEVTDNTAKITTITSDVANLNAELATLVGTTLPALKDELKALIDTNASEISSLKTALATLQTTVDNNSTTITNLQADLVAKATELANLQTALNNLSDKVDANAEDIVDIIDSLTEFHDDYVKLVSKDIPALKDELKALIDTNAGDITTLEKALEALGKDVDTNTDTIADVKAALDVLTTDTAKDIKALSDKINKINSSITSLKSSVSALQKSLDKEVENRTTAINNLRTELNDKITANATDIAALQEALASQANDTQTKLVALRVALTEKIEKNATDIAALQAALDAQVATLTASIEALDAKAEEYAETLAEIAEWQTTYAAKVAANEKEIKTLQTDLDAAEAKIANLEKLQADLQKKVTEIEALQTALSATVASNGEAIEALQTALNEKVTELKGLLTEVNAEIDGNAASIKSLKAAVEAEIATIEAWQTAFDAKVAANKAEIEKLQSQVSALEEQVEALDSDNSVLLAVTIIAIAFSLTSLAVSSIMWVKKLEQKEETVEDEE